MAQNPSQLFLLADHVKLSLLERQRAQTLQLDFKSRDGEIGRSLQSLKAGIETLGVLQEYVLHFDTFHGHLTFQSSDLELQQQAHILRKQCDVLIRQFNNGSVASYNDSTPNDSSLAADFSKDLDMPPSSLLKRADRATSGYKSVRFSDFSDESANRDALLPYRDEPEDTLDHQHMNNQQVHEYHAEVLRRQDDELDTLGVSIGRQRELSIRIGEELDEQVQILDHVDDNVSRHQTQVDRAKNSLGRVSRKAKENMSLTIISILIIILVLLLIVL